MWARKKIVPTVASSGNKIASSWQDDNEERWQIGNPYCYNHIKRDYDIGYVYKL